MYNPKADQKFRKEFSKQFPPREPSDPENTFRIQSTEWGYGDKHMRFNTSGGSFRFNIDFKNEVVRALLDDSYHITVEFHASPRVGLLLWNNTYIVSRDLLPDLPFVR